MDDMIEGGLCNILQRIWTLNAQDDYVGNDSVDDLRPYTVDNVPIRKLFIGNIAQRSTHKDLEKVFSKYGKLESCYLKKNSGKSNYAFVTFTNIEDALSAMKAGHKKQINLHNRDLRVVPADSWHQPDCPENQIRRLPRPAESNEEDSNEFELNEDALIHKLNDDCLMHIFSFLPIADKVVIERVCKRWKATSQSSWRTFKKLDLTQGTWGFTLNLGPKEIFTSTLRKVLFRCGQFLTHLDFSNFAESLSKSTLTVVARFCPNLHHIDITGLSVSPAGIKALTKTCSNIVEFNLGHCSSQCDPDLSLLFLANTRLRNVKIVRNTINGKCLMNLPASLESLSISECSNVSPCHFTKAIDTFTNLHTLTLDRCVSFNDQTVKAIASRANSLRELHLCDYFPIMSGRCLSQLSELVNLEILDLSKNASVMDDCLIYIGACCKLLKDVDISSCHSVTNEGIAGLTVLPKLEHLNISYLGKITDELLTDMPNLRTLVCRGCPNLHDTGLCNLVEEAKNLELLDLSGCDSVSNEVIEAAIKATLSRSNNVMLKIYVGGTNVKLSDIKTISPFLNVLNVDLSEAFLRPDFDHVFFPDEALGLDDEDDRRDMFDMSDFLEECEDWDHRRPEYEEVRSDEELVELYDLY